MLLFPAAGCSILNYQSWHSKINFDILPIEYRGHWSRSLEPLYGDIDDMINDIFLQMDVVNIHKTKAYLYFFGHSMGAIIAWLIHLRLDQLFGIKIKALFVSSALTPERIAESNLFLNDDDIKRFLTKINLIPEPFFESGFANKYVFPIIRNDFSLLDSIIRLPELITVTKTPIYSFVGNTDQLVSVQEISEWRNYTCSTFETHVLNGNHFFVYNNTNADRLCQCINKIMNS